MADADRTCVPIEEMERASSRSTIVFVLLQLTGLAIPILAAVYFQATKKSLEEKKTLLEKRERELDEKEDELAASEAKERSLPVVEKAFAVSLLIAVSLVKNRSYFFPNLISSALVMLPSV